MPKHSECEKLSASRSQGYPVIVEFLEWLAAQDVELCCYCENDEPGYYPVAKRVEQWGAEFFDIDLNRVEEEQRGMLDDLRQKHKKDDKQKAQADVAAVLKSGTFSVLE